MGTINKIIVIALCLIFLGCSNTAKLYNKIKREDEKLLQNGENNKQKALIQKNVFDFLKADLKKTKHIYYLYLPYTSENDIYKVDVCIYDIDNEKKYVLTIEDFITKKVQYIDETDMSFNNFYSKYYDFILKKFKEGNCQELQKIGNYNYINSTFTAKQDIYEIDLQKGFLKKCSFWEISEEELNFESFLDLNVENFKESK